MRWLLGTLITAVVGIAWVVLAVAIGAPDVLVGHVSGTICAVGATLSLGGRLWS